MNKPNARIARIRPLLTLLLLTTLLTSCANQLIKPSDKYLLDCPVTYLDKARGTIKVKDVVDIAKSNQQALARCNNDKKALREFYKKVCKGKKCRSE